MSRSLIVSRTAVGVESEPPNEAMTSPEGDHTAGCTRAESIPRFNFSVLGVHARTLRTSSTTPSAASEEKAVACKSLSPTTSCEGDGSSAIASDTARIASDRSSRIGQAESVSNTARASGMDARRGKPSASINQRRSSSPVRSSTCLA